jgi:uncharacterized protein
MQIIVKKAKRATGGLHMNAGVWIMLVLTVVLGAVTVYYHGTQRTLDGLSNGGQLLLYTLPRMLFAFAIAGLIQTLVPSDMISEWLGAGSGVRGLLVGTLAGALTPGGPMMHFPIVASLLNSGAGAGPVIAYLTAWSLLGIHRLVIWEVPLLGLEISLVRFVASLIVPPLVGLLGGYIFEHVPVRLSLP